MPVRLAPDPGAGVFETMLVVEGVALEEDAHRRRLRRSAEELYGAGVDWPDAPTGGPLRWRVDVRPSETGIELSCTCSELHWRPDWGWTESPARLIPVTVAAGLGRNKWSDRRDLDRLAAGGGVLLVDAEGQVLETERASVLLVEGDRLVLPPREAEVLPGVTLERVRTIGLEHGLDVVRTRVPLERLLAADEVLLTGSLRGVEPVDGCGRRTWAQWPLGRRLGRWFGIARSEELRSRSQPS
ncbi:MAG TPA: aminotransferase class IV [Candidatus Dormibacteraeota bacterium]|nr:aminotransferase class IV [Candidatus Dormibacteraeota bacterium]